MSKSVELSKKEIAEQKRKQNMEQQKKQKKELARVFSKRLQTLIDSDLKEKRKNGFPYYEQNIYENMGISKKAFNSYKNGDDGRGKDANPKVPDLVALYKIKAYFNVPYSYLFGETTTKNIDNIANGTKFGLDDESLNILEELQANVSKDNIDENYSSIMMLYAINCFIHNKQLLDEIAYLISTIIGRKKINSNFEEQIFKLDTGHFEYMKYKTFVDYLKFFENISDENIPKYISDNSKEIAKKYSGHYQQLINNTLKDKK